MRNKKKTKNETPNFCFCLNGSYANDHVVSSDIRTHDINGNR